MELLERASGGYVNEVHYARVNGRDCVVRATNRAQDSLEWELDLLEEVRSHGLAAPVAVGTTDGHRQVDGVVVFRRLTGSHPSTTADWRAVADYLAKLHDLGTDRAQRPGFASAVELTDVASGSGIDLREMPPEAVAQCRAAWAGLANLPRTVVHGDPGDKNIFIDRGRVALIDWDEARVDTPWFDLAALPDDACPLTGRDRWIARQAASAWEAALAWCSDREYAEWRLSEVAELGEPGPSR